MKKILVPESTNADMVIAEKRMSGIPFMSYDRAFALLGRTLAYRRMKTRGRK